MKFENKGKWIKQIKESIDRKNENSYFNEALPRELDDALNRLPSDVKRNCMKSFYNMTKVDLNNIKASQVHSARQKGNGQWTILINYDKKPYYYIFDPSGNSRGGNLSTSFTSALSNGVAFNIDISSAGATLDKINARTLAKQGSDLDWSSPLFKHKRLYNYDTKYDRLGYVVDMTNLYKQLALKNLKSDGKKFVDYVQKIEDKMRDLFRKLRAAAVQSKDSSLIDRIETFCKPRNLGDYITVFMRILIGLEPSNLEKQYQEYLKRDNGNMSFSEYSEKIIDNRADAFAENYNRLLLELDRYNKDLKEALKNYPDILTLLK